MNPDSSVFTDEKVAALLRRIERGDLTYAAPLSAVVREGCCQAARVSPADLRRLAVRVRLEFQATQTPLTGAPDDPDRLFLWLGGPVLAPSKG